jgi:hypothetical protein
VRLHLSGWTAGDEQWVEAQLCQLGGIESVKANPLTGNVLICFDHRRTDKKTLLAKLHEVWDELLAARQRVPGPRSKVLSNDRISQPVESRRLSGSSLSRVAVRGLLGHAVVDSLWFGAGFLGSAFGLPLAGLGPLHVLMDLAVWGYALGSGSVRSRSSG